MKRALVVQMSARRKAEDMHAEELERRRALELEAERLAAANAVLQAERSAWTGAAAQSLAASLESALVADVTRRVSLDVFGAHLPPPEERDPQGPASVSGLSPTPVEGGRDETQPQKDTDAHMAEGTNADADTAGAMQLGAGGAWFPSAATSTHARSGLDTQAFSSTFSVTAVAHPASAPGFTATLTPTPTPWSVGEPRDVHENAA